MDYGYPVVSGTLLLAIAKQPIFFFPFLKSFFCASGTLRHDVPSQEEGFELFVSLTVQKRLEKR